MKSFQLIAFYLIMVFYHSTSCAQSSQMTFHVGPSIPTSDFKNYDDHKYDGAAAIGLGAGLEYVHPLNSENLNIIADLDLLYNPLNKDIKNDAEDYYDADKITFPKYFNLILSGGMNYVYPLDTKTSLFGKAGLNLGLMSLTNFKVEDSGDEYKETYALSPAIGLFIGGGVLLNNKTEIALTYFGPGKRSFDATYDDGSYTDEDTAYRKVSMVYLTIGFPLNQ